MMSKRTRSILGAAFVAAALAAVSSDLRAQEVPYSEAGVVAGVYGCQPWEYGNPDLFYNFYVPNNCGGVPAQLYLAPRPVPAHVGHTYYTYQPLLPHEFMYPHYRTYRNYYDGGRGVTRAKAVWYSNPLTVALKGVRSAVELPR